MSPVFVFLQVGPEVDVPELFVRSVRKHNPDATIIQCSDPASPAIPGVNEVRRFEGNPSNLMTFRLQCFSDLALNEPALYLDSDMICLRKIEPENLIELGQVAVCRRDFSNNMKIPTQIGPVSLQEYAGKTLGEVYPYLACATAANGSAFWRDCLANLLTLHPKFHFWLGDQEAIRNVAQSGHYDLKLLPEGIYACDPEAVGGSGEMPKLVHFKGPQNKRLMLEWARQCGLIAS